MKLSDSGVQENSTVIRLWRQLRMSMPQWVADSQAVTVIRNLASDQSAQIRLNDTDSTDESASSMQASVVDQTKNSEVDPSSLSLKSDSQSNTYSIPNEWLSTDLWTQSSVYRATKHGRRFIQSSWLYRWLTAEPDAEVVVIDLRETVSLRAVLRRTDQLLRKFIAVMPTSGGLRFGYRLRTQFLANPIRVVSFGLIGLVILSLATVLTASNEPPLAVFLLFALLFIALRGTQETVSWADLTESQWYQTLLALFEPPDPPQTD